MKNVRRLCLVFIILFTSSLFAQDKEVKVFIETNLQTLEDALQNRDFEKIGSVWTEDAMVKFPGKQPITGRKAIIDMHRPMADHNMRIDATTQEVYTAGEYATEIGTYKVINGDDQTIDKGYYSTLWKNVDGNWLIYRDMISSAMPPPGQQGK